MSDRNEIATYGAGCFWCLEAIFQELKGVETVIPGYMGGTVKNPSYKEVCTGRTGHAEVARITYDPTIIDFESLLEVFFRTHDPTTLNRQGNDRGTQYRSVIFYHDDIQKNLAEETIGKLEQAQVFTSPIVTEVVEAQVFYEAEDYHRDYFMNNPEQPYCSAVIRPKVEKFRKVFNKRLK